MAAADEARQTVAAAVERAAASGKRVLVVFGADWCRDSAALESVFGHPLLVPLLSRGFERVHLDVGNRDRLLDIAGDWGIVYAAGLPAVAVLDAEGELVAVTREGELAAARTMGPIEIATLVHRWLPPTLRAGDEPT